METTTTATNTDRGYEVSAGSSMDVVGPLSLADGLVSMSEVMLQDKKAARVSGMPVEVVLRVDAGRLAGPGDEEVGIGEAMPAELDDGTGISAETSRRLSCDAGLVRVSTGDDGELLDVGRKTRTIPTPIRRALRLRDGGCRFPGCTNTRLAGHRCAVGSSAPGLQP